MHIPGSSVVLPVSSVVAPVSSVVPGGSSVVVPGSVVAEADPAVVVSALSLALVVVPGLGSVVPAVSALELLLSDPAGGLSSPGQPVMASRNPIDRVEAIRFIRSSPSSVAEVLRMVAWAIATQQSNGRTGTS